MVLGASGIAEGVASTASSPQVRRMYREEVPQPLGLRHSGESRNPDFRSLTEVLDPGFHRDDE
jgi:hypothetical protein